MNKFSAWAADFTSRDTRSKSLIQTHSRPKRNLYTKLRYRLEVDDQRFDSKNEHSNAFQSTSPEEHHYIASDDASSSVDEDEEEEVCYELHEISKWRQRKRSRLYDDQDCRPSKEPANDVVDREIEPGDTLRSLALRYGCKVSSTIFATSYE